MDLREQKFGMEYEFTGICREEAAEILAGFFNSRYYYAGGTYDTYKIMDNQNRCWKIVYDGSIDAYNSDGDYEDSEYKCELVTPVCRYEDIETIQQLLRRIFENGSRVNASCGIHIHIDGTNHNARSIKNLVNIIASKEDVLIKALKIHPSREDEYCRRTDKDFLSQLNAERNPSIEKIKDIWYRGRSNAYLTHYDSSRYHMLNLHSFFGSNHTIEFRCFNSCKHAGKVKAYIQFCLAVSAQAINQRSSRYQPMDRANDKYTFRTWMLRMQLIGEEFKSCRLHMLANLEGTADYKDREAALERHRQMAQILASRVERARLESPDPENFSVEQLPEHTETEANGQPIFSLREQLDNFLESINADENITLAERNQILAILESKSAVTVGAEAHQDTAISAISSSRRSR
ncbi:amidoligase family protein [Ruminococcus sp. Marseille-P6503]|uniref:amidoligase family protein n=1 Tax=Ruminococcus sp. Marseille-P6503 TaxID=2364796 RepID=UPI000F51BCA7|nr:amidoligase family protein [Ruminococcus sp. Marseille-P6503]